jgi:hypothetical protein
MTVKFCRPVQMFGPLASSCVMVGTLAPEVPVFAAAAVPAPDTSVAIAGLSTSSKILRQLPQVLSLVLTRLLSTPSVPVNFCTTG